MGLPLARHDLHLGCLLLFAAALGFDQSVAEPGALLGRQRRGHAPRLVSGAARVEVGLGQHVHLVRTLGVAGIDQHHFQPLVLPLELAGSGITKWMDRMRRAG
jgi:hypothetical protein